VGLHIVEEAAAQDRTNLDQAMVPKWREGFYIVDEDADLNAALAGAMSALSASRTKVLGVLKIDRHEKSIRIRSELAERAKNQVAAMIRHPIWTGHQRECHEDILQYIEIGRKEGP